MKIVVKDLETNHNISQESDLHIFFKWIWIVAWLVVGLFIFFIFLWNILVNYFSIEDEKKYFPDVISEFNIDENKTKKLKNLLWNNFKYEIAVARDDIENAYALPGWTIIITDSLLNEIKYENSLLLIIWHEVWHIENRDVFKAFVTNMPIAILLSILWIGWDFDLTFLLSGTSDIYSKTVESDADKKGLDFLYNIKGEVWCSLYFFEKRSWLWENIWSLLSGHPMTSGRINNIKKEIRIKWYPENNDCKLLKLK